MRMLRMLAFQFRQFISVPYFVQLMLVATLTGSSGYPERLRQSMITKDVMNNPPSIAFTGEYRWMFLLDDSFT